MLPLAGAAVVGSVGMIRAGCTPECGLCPTAVHDASGPGVSQTGIAMLDFFTGGGMYMPRTHCLRTADGTTDWPWVIALLALSGGVVASYLRIFVFWIRCYFGEAAQDRNKKLLDLAAVFLLCATCGYALSIVMFFWPGYRLLAAFLLLLNFFSWRFCVNLEPFRAAFSAGRLERQLRDEVQSRASTLERLLDERTLALRESEQRVRTLVQNIPGAVFRVAADERRTILFVSDGIGELTGYSAKELVGKAGQDGAGITNPEDLPEVNEAVRAAVSQRSQYSVEYRLMRRDGRARWVLERGQTVCDEVSGDVRYIDGVQFDITDRRNAEEAVRRSAMVDALTGLPNRELLYERLRRCLARRVTRPDTHFGVLFLDFDRFKVVNDSLGHEAGDELLRQIAERLRLAVRPVDTLMREEVSEVAAGRLGGDEFVVILENLRTPEEAIRVAERLLKVCRGPYQVMGHEVTSSASIGVVTSRNAEATADDVLRDADTAMYEAKLAGKDRVMVFDGAMRERVKERLQLEEELRGALARGELRVEYQPIVAMESGRCVGAEALLRWSNARRPVSPTEFVPIAEECGLIVEIGDWVMREVARTYVGWRIRLGAKAPESVSVNLSRSQLACSDLPARVQRVLKESGLEPSRLQLEITENQAVSSRTEQIDALRRLREIGVKLAMDDFGTGMSSLSGLHQMPIDVVKIDRSFVNHLGEGKQFMALARSIIELAGNLGLKTVAEGIETAEHLAALQALGCGLGQGYYFARPMAPEAFESYLLTGVDRRAAA